jgi:hypothetical protein
MFAAGSTNDHMTIEVRWRGGEETVISDVRPNRIYLIDEPAGLPAKPQRSQRTNATANAGAVLHCHLF